MYPRIHHRLFCEPWAISAAAYDSIRSAYASAVAARAAGAPLPKPPPELASQLAYSAIGNFTGPASDPAAAPTVPGQIAIVSISGIIAKRIGALEAMCGGRDLDAARADFLSALHDPLVTSIVLHIDSPGGQVTGTPEFAALVRRAARESGKEIIGYTDTQACSAGYWILSQCQAIYAAPTAALGSIGCRMSLLDQSARDAREGLVYTTIVSDAWKDLGNPHRTATAEELAALQGQVDAIASGFAAAVSAARPDVDPAAIGARVLDGAAALAAGLADGHFDTLDDLLDAIMSSA